MLTLDTTDTIAAVASPARGGWRGLVRITGPAAFDVGLAAFTDQEGTAHLPPRRAERRWGSFQVAGLRTTLAAEVNLWPGSRTSTGQPLVEVQTTGAPPILQRLLASFLKRGARLAEPGEFTLRAFLAGRIDLTQAEAVLGVIDAQSPEQLAVALRQLAGGLAEPLVRLRDDLADTLAHLEANLDFADEADVDPLGRAELARSLDRQADTVAALAARLGGRDRAGGRPRVVLVGPPNAGKSRLFNALIGFDRALVSPVAGTTRDYLEAECDCAGVRVDLVDTAGVEAAAAPLARLAQEARVGQARGADLLLDCQAASAIRDDSRAAAPLEPNRLRIWTKADLDPAALIDPSPTAGGVVTSAATGRGLAALRSAIAGQLRSAGTTGLGDSVAATAARSGASLTAAARALGSAAATIQASGGDELVAVDLRQAIDDLGRVVGAVVTDDILDRIFRRFCIGK